MYSYPPQVAHIIDLLEDILERLPAPEPKPAADRGSRATAMDRD